MTEVVSHHADGAEIRLQVHENVARMAEYLVANAVHPEYDSKHKRPPIELRPYQLETLDATAGARQEGVRRNLLDIGMGLGKTTIALTDAFVFQEESRQADRQPPAFLWLAHSIPILHQARARLHELFPNVTSRILTGKRRESHDAQYTFAMLQTMEGMKEQFGSGAYQHITVDESHHGPADTYGATIGYFDPEYLLGITGTAYRMDGRNLQDIFGDTVYRMPMTRGIAEGWLVPLDYRLQVDQAVRRILRDAEGNLKQSQQLLHAPGRYREIIRVIQDTQQEVGTHRTIAFLPGKANSRLFADRFPGSLILDSDVPEEEQPTVMKHYRTKENSTLVTIEMATEGVDVPETNIIALLRLTDSRGLFEQSIARGVRPAPGKERLIVLDFAGNSERLYMLQNFLDQLRDEYRRRLLRRAEEEGAPPPDPQQLEEEVERFVGSQIHFTEYQIDMIDRMQQIQEAPPLEAGWHNARTIAEGHDTTVAEITNIIKDLLLEGTIMRAEGASDVDLFYSPEHQDYIDHAVAWNKQTADWETRFSLMRKTGRTRATLEMLARDKGTPFRPLRIGSNLAIIPPETSKAILEECGRDGMTISRLAAVSGKNRYQVRKAIAELEITGNNIGGKPDAPVIVFGAADSQRVLAELAKQETLAPPPDGYTAMRDAQAQMPEVDLYYLVSKHGIEPKQFSNDRNQPTGHLSPDQLAQVREIYDKLEKGTPIAQVATRLKISEPKARSLAKELFGHDTRLSDAEIKKLGNDPYITTPVAPKTYKLKNEIVTSGVIGEYAFEKAVEALGLQPQTFKTRGNRPLLLPHFSPEERRAIINYAKEHGHRVNETEQSAPQPSPARPEPPRFDQSPQPPPPPKPTSLPPNPTFSFKPNE